MNKKLYIETYGCQMNVGDSEVIFSILAKEGYGRTEDISEADVILANTCSVRDNAEQRIWGRLEQFHKQKENRPQVVVGIVGCMAERLKDKLLETGKVDLVAGPDSYRTLPVLLRDVAPDKPQINVMLSHEETYADIIPVRTDRNGVSAFISIMRGCNNVCSYCVVPYTRGAERSRDPKTIVREACDLFSKGYKEVTLLGQNVDSYLWKSPEGDVDFADLLAELDKIDGDYLLRFMSSQPKDASFKLFDTMARSRHVAHQLHLPVQSGCDRVLRAMNRPYDVEKYLELITYARRVMPELVLTSDVIIGFPGETEAEAMETVALVEKVRFDALFTFIFSPRPGTPAARLPDPVPREEKQKWFDKLLEVQNGQSAALHAAYIGKTVRVLVDGKSDDESFPLASRTEGNRLVRDARGKLSSCLFYNSDAADE